jgi:urease accessory protein
MPIILNRRLDRPEGQAPAQDPPQDKVLLTADDRLRSRYPIITEQGVEVYLDLPRGSQLNQGDRLGSTIDGLIVEVIAKPEPVLTARAANPLDLLQAAYHLGNRHVPLEIQPDCLRLGPDPVLADMLRHRGLDVVETIEPFHPERGAYGSHGSHSHSHSESHSHSHGESHSHSHGSHSHSHD